MKRGRTRLAILPDGTSTQRRPVLLTVSGVIPAGIDEAVATGRRPRVDYLELARGFDADLIDYSAAAQSSGLIGRLIARLLGDQARLAWCCFRARNDYDVIVTDGEQIGLPLAALLWWSRRSRRARHMMIVHIMSTRSKTMLYRVLRLGRHIDEMLVYATAQREFIANRLRYPRGRITVTTFMVDTDFFAPTSVGAADNAPLLCSAGLEFRDYPTMIEAIGDLDVNVVLAAASPWSKRGSELDGIALAPNITVTSLDLAQLRQLYADSTVVVMPLLESDFQAGITTILEAMSMAKPLVCTRTSGQTDTIIDGVTGVYVPPGNSAALRAAIEGVLDDRDRSAALGSAAREWVREHADIDCYVERLTARVAAHRTLTS